MYVNAKSLQAAWWTRISTKALFFVLASILVFIFVAYGLLVNKTIMNVVARENAQKTVASVSTDIGALEAKYISLKNTITLDLAYSRGFQDSLPSKFISRGPTTLSFNDR